MVGQTLQKNSPGARKTVRLLIYIGYMMAFYKIGNKLTSLMKKVNTDVDDDSHPLSRRLGFAPNLICESLVSKFCEKSTEKGNNSES